MPSYTLPLKTVRKIGGGTWDAIGLADYIIHDEARRENLNDKIYQHYLNEEVAHETISMFRQSMKSRMQIIMPYYNELYASTQLEFDPLNTVDVTTDNESNTSGTGTVDRTSDTTTDADSTQSSSSDGTGSGKNYNYPNQQMRPDGQYASSGQDSESQSSSSGESHDVGASNTVDNTGTTSAQDSTGSVRQHGRTLPAQELIMAYRDTLLNIDQLIIVELEDLFMGTWTTGQAFFGSREYGYTPYIGYGY